MSEIDLVFLGICIGLVLYHILLHYTCKVAATLIVDTSDEKKDKYTFELKVPMDTLHKYDMIRVKTKFISNE